MSGINGLYHLDGRPVSRRDVQHMTQCLAHRGPDGAGIWVEGDVGLGHCRRVKTPEEPRQAGPCLGESAHLVLTADARLDNREDLIGQLGWKDRPARSISDDALILGAYVCWGERCPEYLLGDFAFALWDAHQHRLFCARDHFGLKPFYYIHSAASFAFASEMKALLELPWAPRRPNETRVADFLMQMVLDTDTTFYDGILRLPPAHTLTVTPAGVRLQPYWALDPGREIHYASDADYAEAFRELFVDAVRCRMSSTAPIGAFLSGGLDSSAVTGVARSLLGADETHPLSTFSVVFDELPQCDERSYIEAVLAQGGLKPHFVHGDQINPFDELDRMLWHVEEPFFTPNLYLCWQLYRSAQVHGVGVVLDGFLGDNVVSHGDRYLTELAATGRWFTLACEVHTVAGVLGNRRKSYQRLARQYILAPLLLEPLHRTWAWLTQPELPASPYSQFINADFARRIGWMERARAFGEDVPRTPHSTRQGQVADLRSAALSAVLEIVNKAAAALAVTPHFPFTDRRLMEYCLAVPATQKCQGGRTRVYARRGLREYLPDAIRQRYGKTYWHLSLNHSLLALAQDELDSFMFDRLPIAAAYVNVAALQQAYRQLRQMPQPGHPMERRELLVSCWTAVVLTRWLEREEEEERSDRRTLPTAAGGLT